MALSVLFVCTANAARSPMAEALLREVGGETFEASSAGTAPRDKIHPLAVRVLSRIQIDVRGRKPRALAQLQGQRFDYVVTLDDAVRAAAEATVSAGERVHWNIADPLENPTELGFIEVMKQLRRRVELFATVAQRAGPSKAASDP